MLDQMLSQAQESLDAEDVLGAARLFATVWMCRESSVTQRRNALEGMCKVLEARGESDRAAQFRQQGRTIVLQLARAGETGSVAGLEWMASASFLCPQAPPPALIAEVYTRAYELARASNPSCQTTNESTAAFVMMPFPLPVS
jgi:hypothetical protein